MGIQNPGENQFDLTFGQIEEHHLQSYPPLDHRIHRLDFHMDFPQVGFVEGQAVRSLWFTDGRMEISHESNSG